MRVERKIFKIVEDQSITGFADLVDYLVRNDLHSEFEEIYEHPEFYDHYLRSRFLQSETCQRLLRDVLSEMKPSN